MRPDEGTSHLMYVCVCVCITIHMMHDCAVKWSEVCACVCLLHPARFLLRLSLSFLSAETMKLVDPILLDSWRQTLTLNQFFITMNDLCYGDSPPPKKKDTHTSFASTDTGEVCRDM